MSKLIKAVVLGVVLGLGLGACGEEQPIATAIAPGATSQVDESPTVDVTLAQFSFKPDSIMIDVGETIAWTNTDRILHTVTAGTPDAPDGLFDFSLDDAGSTAEQTFVEAGDYQYFCAVHPHMVGVVIVTDSG